MKRVLTNQVKSADKVAADLVELDALCSLRHLLTDIDWLDAREGEPDSRLLHLAL